MKIKTSWDLGLLYKSDKDPQIEKDLKSIEGAYLSFEKKYKSKPFTKSPNTLLKALKDYEKLCEQVSGSKPWWYFALRKDLNSGDNKSNALATRYEQFLTEYSNRVKFFRLEIAKINGKDRNKFLKDASLKPFHYFLNEIFAQAKFNLTEKEEQLDGLLSQTSYTMWVDAQQKLLNQQVIRYKGREMPITKATAEISDMSKSNRRIVGNKVNQVLKSISHVAESEINAVYNYKKIMDNRRGFKKPYSETILGYQNNEKSVEDFVELVTKSFKISHRFSRLHAKLMGEKKLTIFDRNVSLGKINKEFNFKESVSIVRSVFEKIDKDYANILDKYLENGQIDVYPKTGKRGGAYCWGMGKLHVFVLLNHVNNIRSLETLAHEMGHAFHTEMSKGQPVLYRGYTTSTAEVASTFFEQAVVDEIENHLSDKEKAILLHRKIIGDISTIFRQVACFNFEKELHERIRDEGQLTKEEIAKLMSKHLRSYLGSAVEVTDDDGYAFVSWPHIRRFFYVYTYAHGQLISKALYENYKKDPMYADKVKSFLKAGQSMSPEDIFKSIGVDISKPEFFEIGLRSIEKDIDRLEKLTSK